MEWGRSVAAGHRVPQSGCGPGTRVEPCQGLAMGRSPRGGEGCGKQGLGRPGKLVNQSAEGRGVRGSARPRAVGEGRHGRAEPRSGRAGARRCPAGCARTAGAPGPGPASALPANPPAPGRPSLVTRGLFPQGPTAAHLPGGRSAAPPPPSRSPDPSPALRPGGRRAGGIIAVASAHPGSRCRGEPGAQRRRHRAAAGAAPSAPSAGHPGRRPARPRALAASRASRRAGAAARRPAPREVRRSGARATRWGDGGQGEGPGRGGASTAQRPAGISVSEGWRRPAAHHRPRSRARRPPGSLGCS